MQVLQVDGKGNRDGICKYRNLTVKTSVGTGMPEDLNINALVLSFFLFDQHTVLQPHSGRPCIPDVRS